MNARWIACALIFLLTANLAFTQSPAVAKEIEKARGETLPRATKAIEDAIDAKIVLELDVASFGEDSKAWSNLPIITNRIVAAFGEVGKDQAGKDAIVGGVRKVIIARLATDTAEDTEALTKEGTLTVQTTGTDNAVALLQGVITRALEKAL